jgi:hypothetical protein
MYILLYASNASLLRLTFSLISLAMMEMTLTMAHMFRRYDVQLANPDEELELSAQFLTKPGKLIESYLIAMTCPDTNVANLASGQMNVVLRSREN